MLRQTSFKFASSIRVNVNSSLCVKETETWVSNEITCRLRNSTSKGQKVNIFACRGAAIEAVRNLAVAAGTTNYALPRWASVRCR
jgi:hypothetical protein